MSEADRPPFEILEHTADIGLRAFGDTREVLFENCARGLADILDRQGTSPEAGPTNSIQTVSVELRANDMEALLVEWMNEVLFMLEPEDVCLALVVVHGVNDARLAADCAFTECPHTAEGTELKAATYHQLSVRQSQTGWEATVYFDV